MAADRAEDCGCVPNLGLICDYHQDIAAAERRAALALGADLADAVNLAVSRDPAVRCEDCGGRLGAPSDPEGRIVDGCVCDGPWAEPGWVGM